MQGLAWREVFFVFGVPRLMPREKENPMSDTTDQKHAAAAIDHDDEACAEDTATGDDYDVVALAAAHLRQGAKDVELQLAPSVPGATTLLAWGYFNPFGPTANRIDMLPVTGTGEALLVCASDHPMFPSYHAISLIPPGVDLAAAVPDALAAIFGVNGGGYEWGLVGGVPSYVHILSNSPVDRACAAELLRSAMAMVDEVDYGQEIQDLVRAWQDPWGQAADAVNRSLQGPTAKRVLAQIRRLKAGLPDDDDHDRQDSGEDNEDDTDELFDLWFALATQPEYVERIEGQMAIAWRGAQAFQAGAYW